MTNPISSVQFQSMKGFRFRPTHEELISNYLVPKTHGDKLRDLLLMPVINLCKHEPWDLPAKSNIESDDLMWYFFGIRDPKYSNSKRSNRRTKAGFWKSTCHEKPITAKRTKKVIGTRKTLVFHEKTGPKGRRTGWIIYEYDIIIDCSLSNKGQYVLYRLEKKSDEKTKKGEKNHHVASVPDFDAEPSQSMVSNLENQIGSEMTVNSAFDASEVSHHVASDHFENQNSNELNSALQVSELNPNLASDFRNLNSNKLKFNSACDGSGSLHSSFSNSETQYLNQPAVDSAYNGSKSHYKAFDSETQNLNNILAMPTHENRLVAYEKWLMASGLKNQESPFQPEGKSGTSVVMPSILTNLSTNDSEQSSLMASCFKNQNLDKETDISAFDEGEWSDLTATPPDFEYQNPCKKTDMSTLGEGYSSNSTTSISDNSLADVALPEVFFKALEKLVNFLEV